MQQHNKDQYKAKDPGACLEEISLQKLIALLAARHLGELITIVPSAVMRVVCIHNSNQLAMMVLACIVELQ